MATQKGRNWSSGDIVTAVNLSLIERGVSAVSSSYEPTTWANGDTVTAAALNNIEQGIANAGGGISWQTVFEGSVTTVEEDGLIVGGINYSELLSVDTIKVTFNGVEYTCNKITLPIGNGYGEANQQGPDFTNYPFFIESTDSGLVNTTAIYTETAGTYSIKIEAPQSGGGDSWVILTEESVTTEDMDGVYGAFLSYSQLIFANTIRVTFDGNEYMCNVNNMEELYVYGGFSQAGPDFSEYPFVIVSTSQAEEDVNQIITETSGTHTVKIEVLQDSASGDFSTAVVIVVNADTNTIWDNCPALDLEDNILIGGFYPDSSRMTVLVPLYKGKCYWDISSQGLALVGNVTQHSHGLLITGDCTITASGESGR